MKQASVDMVLIFVFGFTLGVVLFSGGKKVDRPADCGLWYDTATETVKLRVNGYDRTIRCEKLEDGTPWIR